MVIGGLALAVGQFPDHDPVDRLRGAVPEPDGRDVLGAGVLRAALHVLDRVGRRGWARVHQLVGNSAGFLGPYLVGWVTATFGSARWALVTIGLVLAAGGLLAGSLRLTEPSTVPEH